MSNTETSGILLIGNSGTAVFGAAPTGRPAVQVCGNIHDAIETTRKTRFTAIAVVMKGTATNLRDGLALLRENTNAKILLLARMYEEPEAIKLVGSNGASLADDYIICPVQTERLYNVVCRGPLMAVAGKEAAISDTTLQAKIGRLEKLATEDDLTGLKNRRYLWEFAKQIIARAKKDNGRVTVLIFDIDDFKHYNDIYGHAAGDEVLKQASLLIRRCCRRHDVVGRIGGDEFAVVFWDDPKCPQQTTGSERRSYTMDHPGEVIFIAKRFRREIEKTDLRFLGPDGRGVLTISGGLASLNRDGSTTEELFEKADQALLEAKRSGKNRIYLVGQPQNDIDKIE
ncbi:MAG: GGDEF domain-containing protein [Sedimentisphaerales bacterium]